MSEQIEIGSLVFCYSRERFFGHCSGLKTVIEIAEDNGLEICVLIVLMSGIPPANLF